MGTKIALPEILLNTQTVLSVRLSTKVGTYLPEMFQTDNIACDYVKTEYPTICTS
jgi:hypothetical protein